MSDNPKDSSGRWWEIRGEGQADEDGHRELMTDSRGRSRPERSLSAGADLAEEPHHPSRAFLWPIVSVVAAVGLILSVIYGVSRDKATPTGSTKPPEATARGSAPDDVGVKQDSGVTPAVPPQAPLGNLPAIGGGAPPPIAGWDGSLRTSGAPAGTPGAPAGIPGAPAAAPGSPASTSSGSPGSAAGSTGNQPSGTPTSSTAAPYPAPTLEGPAPAAPRSSHQVGPPEPGRGGCKLADSKYYSCTIPHDAPYYLAGTTERRGPVHGEYPFLCQSAGSEYSVGDRANHWWAWLWVPYIHVVIWVPVVFLTGGPDNAPEPGLPVCDRQPTSTTTPPATSTSSAPTTTPTTPRKHAR